MYARSRIVQDKYINPLTAEEQAADENSLKYYRDLHNVVDTSRQEGREEGFEAGRESATTRLVIRLLKKRFGDLSSAQAAAVKSLTVEVAEALSEAMLDFATIDELETWLSQF